MQLTTKFTKKFNHKEHEEINLCASLCNPLCSLWFLNLVFRDAHKVYGNKGIRKYALCLIPYALYLLFLPQQGLAQNNFCFTVGASVQLTVMGDGNLDFIFNTIAKYETGVTSFTKTTIGITITDAAALPDYATWEITADAEDWDGDGFLTSTDPANQIPFNTIELSAVPTATEVLLVNGDPPDAIPPDRTNADSQIEISYRCGFPPITLLGYPADYYSDTIIFTLSAYE